MSGHESTVSQSHLKSNSLTRTLMCRYHTLVRKVCHHHLAAPGVTSTELESLWVLSQNLFLRKRFLPLGEVRWPEAECKWVWPARGTPCVPSSTVTTRKQSLRNARLNPTHPKWSSLCGDSWDPTCPSFFSLPYLTQAQSIQGLLTTLSPSFSSEWTRILWGRWQWQGSVWAKLRRDEGKSPSWWRSHSQSEKREG